ncbi:MAG TPA: C40 family peptidase [Streptosporangiaceae bacterium]|nr:C40 family peptidase [Streptosporangiaceae bacterium]
MRDRVRRLGSVVGTAAALGSAAALAAPASAGAATTAGTRSLPPPAGQSAPAARGSAVPVAQTPAGAPQLTALRRLHPADLLVVAPRTLRAGVIARIRKLPGITATARLDAATIRVNGKFVQMLGVSPGEFRAFAAGPTARSVSLWRSVAAGSIALSYTMGRQDKLPLGGTVHVAGQRTETLRVGGFGTVGISGVDAVVSDTVARSLGIPAGNALVISAPHARLAELMTKVRAVVPKGAGVAQLVGQVEPGQVVSVPAAAAGAAGATTTAGGPPLTTAQVRAFLRAAMSRVGMPYVWGAAGPASFDCSGLVQWSMRQAGLLMPRVAVDQARTGPRVSLGQLQPGDLLFYHTDATAPSYISHVAIYLGNGMMEQAPQPGMDVEIVKAEFGSEFAGAVQVFPRLAAAVAGDPAG